MERVKIVYFHQYFTTPAGAAGTRSYEMACRLVARGHEVLMVCGSAKRGETGLSGPFVHGRRRGMIAEGFEVLEFELGYANSHGLLRRTLAFLSFARRSMAVALQEPMDLIFATTTPLTAAIPGIGARWFRRTPFVFEVRDLWPELPRAMGVIRNRFLLLALSALEWVSYRTADRLIGLSPGIVDGIARRGVDRSRIAMIPNGCDLKLFAPVAEPRRPAGVAPADLLAVFAGAHGIANGLHAVLDAAAELQRRGRLDVKLVLIGDGGVKDALVRRAAAEQLTNVIFLPAVNKRELASVMRAADVGLQILADVPAFYFGTSPNKFFDYIAAGLPVLINYPGWLAELVREHRAGLAVPPRNPASFADALLEAADDRVALRAMGVRARELAEREFERGQLANRFADVLEGAVR